MSAPHVYVLVDPSKKGLQAVINAYTTFAAARNAAEKLHGSFEVKQIKVLEGEDASIDPAKAANKAQNKPKKATKNTAVVKGESDNEEDKDENEHDDEADDNDEEDEAAETNPAPAKPKPATKSNTKAKTDSKTGASKKPSADTDRKEIPDGKRDALKGHKLLFTGTFETMDRDTSKATAKLHGAQVITKLEDTDYIVLGTRAGTKKLETISELGLKTISEQEFLDMLQNGAPADIRKRISDRDNNDDGPSKKKAKR